MSEAIETAGRVRSALAAGARVCVVVLGATVAAAQLEALLFARGGLLGVWTAAGYVLLHGFLPGAAAVLLVRALVHSWGLRALRERWTRADGSAPRVAAWLGWVALAPLAFGLGLLYGTERLLSLTRAPTSLALSVMAGGVVLAVALAAVTPAALRGLELVAGRWSVTARRAGWTFAGLVAVILVGVETLVVRPRVGHLELNFMPFVAAYLAACAAGFALERHLRGRRRKVATVATVAAALLSLACAVYAVRARLDVVLAVWGDAPIGGRAIERFHDLYALRERSGLDTVAPPATARRHPSVVLVTIDTMRADRTPIIDGPADMPALETLARAGASFDWALAPSNVTRRSIPATVTGASPRRVRGRVAGWALRLDPRHVLLAERFAAAGYDTAGYACCESFFAERHRLGWIRGLDTVFLKREGRTLAERAVEWLASRDRDGRPAFVWLHLIEPHQWESDFSARDLPGESRAQRYDRSLAAADRALAPLVRYLTEGDALEHTLVAVTSDHGEGLGDHGAAYHASDLYNSQVRVPLVLAGPGVVRGARIRTPVGLVDLAPTLLDLAGFRPPGMPAMDGRSFAALVDDDPLNDDDAPGEAYSVMVKDRSVAQSRWALLSGRHKLVVLDDDPEPDPAEVELYDVVADPNERSNLAPLRPSVVEGLLERLRERRRVDSIPAF